MGCTTSTQRADDHHVELTGEGSTHAATPRSARRSLNLTMPLLRTFTSRNLASRTAHRADEPSTAPPADEPSTAPPTDEPSTAPPTDEPSTASLADEPSTASPADKPPPKRGGSASEEVSDVAMSGGAVEKEASSGGAARRSLDRRLIEALNRIKEPDFEAASRDICTKTSDANVVLGIEQSLERAKMKAQSFTDEELSRDGLTRDQASALSLYTDLCAGSPGESRFYKRLNQLLREQDWVGLQPFLSMIKLISCALSKLSPTVIDSGVYRVSEQSASAYSKGEVETFWGFTSTTTELEEAEKFIVDQTQSNTVFVITTSATRSLRRYSLYPSQEELLVPAGVSFKVRGKLRATPTLTIVQLEEVESPNCVLRCTRMFSPRRLPQPSMPVLSLFRDVGPKPADRTWQDEWLAMLTEDRIARNWKNCATEGWDPCTLESVSRPDGKDAIDRELEKRKREIEWKVDQGWSRDDAEAFSVLISVCAQPIARAMREQVSDFAASSHRLNEIFAARVLAQDVQGAGSPPPCYRNLTGKFGYATQFPEWCILENVGSHAQAQQLIGSSLRTIGCVTGYTASEHFSEGGFCVPQRYSGSTETHWSIQAESDVVQLVSGTGDARASHSLICDSEFGTQRLPPAATVTIIDVKQPGEWEVAGVKVQQRLWVTTVAHGANLARL